MPVVLGGGISGLTAAYYLNKLQINPITIYEASKHLGGWIRTENFDKDKYIFESGPRTIRPKGPAASSTLDLIEEIGLNSYVNPIFSTHPAAKKRMIYAKKKLHPLPSSFFSGLFLKQPPFSKPLISGIFQDLKAPKCKNNDESIYDFVERRFGSEIAQYAVSSLICGICAGDAKEISVRFLMNDIFEKEQTFGSVSKGIFYEQLDRLFSKEKKTEQKNSLLNSCNLARKAKEEKWSIYSLKGGLQTLPNTLAENLINKGVNIKIDTECLKINFYDNKVILNIKGVDEHTDYIISSIPTHKLASLVEHQHPSFANQLRSIPYVDVAVVNLRYNIPNLLHEEAFGFLVPPVEKLPILGVIFDSCCFDMEGNTVLTVMMGGKWFQQYFGNNPTEQRLLDTALKCVKTILNINETPETSKVNILRKCIPQYTVGHKDRIKSIREYIEKNRLPMSICGAAYDGVGVNDVIFSAKNTILSLSDKLKHKT